MQRLLLTHLCRCSLATALSPCTHCFVTTEQLLQLRTGCQVQVQEWRPCRHGARPWRHKDGRGRVSLLMRGLTACPTDRCRNSPSQQNSPTTAPEHHRNSPSQQNSPNNGPRTQGRWSHAVGGGAQELFLWGRPRGQKLEWPASWFPWGCPRSSTKSLASPGSRSVPGKLGRSVTVAEPDGSLFVVQRQNRQGSSVGPSGRACY